MGELTFKYMLVIALLLLGILVFRRLNQSNIGLNIVGTESKPKCISRTPGGGWASVLTYNGKSVLIVESKNGVGLIELEDKVNLEDDQKPTS